jgi:hypothetical protein
MATEPLQDDLWLLLGEYDRGGIDEGEFRYELTRATGFVLPRN